MDKKCTTVDRPGTWMTHKAKKWVGRGLAGQLA